MKEEGRRTLAKLAKNAKRSGFAGTGSFYNFPVGAECHPVAVGIQPGSGDVLEFFNNASLDPASPEQDRFANRIRDAEGANQK